MARFTRREFIKAAGGFVSAATLAPGLMDLAHADGTKRFNILWLMTDQHHHGVMGCSGNPVVKTPNLDKLASQGARFTNAVCATPFCSPTRAALITGLWPHTNGVVTNIDGTKPGLTDKTVATEQLLFDKGYETYQMGKWHLGKVEGLRCYRKDTDKLSQEAYKRWLKAIPRDKWDKPREGEVQIDEVCYTPGMAEFHKVWSQETNRSAQDLSTIGRYLRPAELNYESWLADRCIEQVRKHKNDNFMITWSVSPPHALWIAPEPYYSMYDPAKMPLPPSFGDHPKVYQNTQPGRMGRMMGEPLIREYLRCYYGQVTMIDALVGRILDTLKTEGLEKDTLVIFTSDHGDMQAAHGMPCKSLPAYYDDIVRVPLIMRYPGSIKPGTVVNTHWNSVDMMPTLLDYAGLPVPKDAQGVSMRPILEGNSPDDGRPAFCERGNKQTQTRMVRTKEWKYAVYGNERRELFSLEKDPCEITNLAEDPKHSGDMAKLHRLLRDQMEKTNDPARDVLPKA